MTETRVRPRRAKERRGMHVSRRARVLLAEDDDEMRYLLAGALLKQGHDVVPMPNGLQLLEEVATSERRGDPVDVVITDVRMPGVTGLEALEWLRELGCRAPLLVITAFGDEPTHAEARRLGATAVLDKPFDMEVLTRLVEEVLACPE
ncbi:MAG TPA: response regulator [Candidatus Krumholzibacteria bacterium]|nr:response regulator [Candidatus Krumholzibacteria bacterium]